MQAIVRRDYGGPDELFVTEVPDPEPAANQVKIKVKAIGLNHAELYMRKGLWGEVAKISGIECVGVVEADPSGTFPPGRKVAGIMGGMGRTLNGSYAQYTCVPATNVLPIDSDLRWEQLAAMPECYCTAWTFLHGNLEVKPGQTLLVRGGTSALGQAAIRIAADAGVRVIATTRSPQKLDALAAFGAAEPMCDHPDLSMQLRSGYPNGIDAVLELVGNRTLLDSLKMVRPAGRVCIGGFLGGLGPIESFNPLIHLPSGVQLSFFGSFMFGTSDFPLSKVPFKEILEKAAGGDFRIQPAKVFEFGEMAEAHRLMESNQALGKIVVLV